MTQVIFVYFSRNICQRPRLLVLLALVCLLRPISAQPLAPCSMDALVASAGIICTGTVTDVRQVEPDNPYANYEAHIRVDEMLKGSLTRDCAIRYPGPPPALSTRASARADGLTPLTLAVGDRRIFLLEGGCPMQLAHLRQGILPLDQLSEVRTLLRRTMLALTMRVDSTHVTPAQMVTVSITLKNTGPSPIILRLPDDLRACCRFLAWREGELLPDPPLRWLPLNDVPASYRPVTLASGEERTATIRVVFTPSAKITSPQRACLAAWVYPFLLDAPQPIAAEPLVFTIAPR